jgi:hypothetical protein
MRPKLIESRSASENWPTGDFSMGRVRRDHLTMGYFVNFNNGFLNKYEINLKNRKKL